MRAGPSSARSKSHWGILCAAMIAMAAVLAAPAALAQFTTTTLAVSPTTAGGGTSALTFPNPYTIVAAGTAVTLTAAVFDGQGYIPRGVVTFCDASGPHCEDEWKIGTAELGNPVISFIPGVGGPQVQSGVPRHRNQLFWRP
jgi:hypothetical protein